MLQQKTHPAQKYVYEMKWLFTKKYFANLFEIQQLFEGNLSPKAIHSN